MTAHVTFPLRLDARGRSAGGTDEEYLCGLIEQVLFTRPGERVNRPDFGSGVQSLVFAPLGDELVGTTQALVRAALQNALGELLRVDDVTVATEETTLHVTVAFTPAQAPTGQPPSVVRVSNVVGGAP